MPSVKQSDVFLVSYPKSGNTWVRFVLAHLKTHCQEQLNFLNLRNTIPAFRKPRDRDLIGRLPSPRILKSHDRFTRYFPKVIYLLRDPRDVYASYFIYMRPRLPEKLSLGEFVQNKRWRHHINWVDHLQDWQRHPNVLLVRYEDLKEDPLHAFSRILDWTPEFNWNKDLLPRALEMSSFQQLRAQEREHGLYYQNLKPGQKPPVFVRKGVVGDWRNHLREEDLLLIETRAGEMMERFGYT